MGGDDRGSAALCMKVEETLDRDIRRRLQPVPLSQAEAQNERCAVLKPTFGMTTRESFQESPTASQIDESYSSQFSFPSQPLDIKKWFFSYQYESQVCSDSSHDHEDDEKKLFLKVSSEDNPVHPKDENTVESRNFWSSEGSSQNEYSLKSDSFTSEGKIDLFFDERPTLGSSEKSTIPSGCSPYLKNENSIIIEKNSDNDRNPVSSENGILQLEEAFPKHDSLQSKSKQSSHLLGGSSYTEQKENIVVLQDNGFISTKNTKGAANKNGESSKVACLAVNRKRRNKIELQEPISILGKEQSFSERRVLTDQTNVLFAEEAIAAEVSGKWKCPRKSKPYVGPPFKQLRLERWMRQV